MTPTNELTARLREYNRWRRGDELLEQMHIADIGEMLDEAADRLEELERELAAERAVAVNLPARLREIADAILFGRPSLVARQAADRLEELERELAVERALSDEMAAQLDHAQYTYDPGGCQKMFAAWKDARHE
jgi:hypothetical protein